MGIRGPFARSRNIRLPLVDFQWRFELKGFTAVERATLVVFGDSVMPSSSLSVTMDREAKTPPGMVHQTDGVAATLDAGPLQKTPAALLRNSRGEPFNSASYAAGFSSMGTSL